MGNSSSQSYDLAQAQARANEGHREPEEIVSPQDQFCRPVSMASTSSMRKPPKNKNRSKEVDKENVSVTSSGTATSSPASLYKDVTRESAVDVPKTQKKVPASPVPSERTIEVLTESVLSKAFELEKSELEPSHVTHVEVKAPKENRENQEQTAEKKVVNEEKERAKAVAEEAVRQLETKRGSLPEEALHRAEEVEKTPLEEGEARKATENMEEQKSIEEVTRQLDEAIDETQNEETSVVVQEGSIEYATVSLARDEDISAIETDCIVTEQKLFYTSQLSPALVDALPSQTHYDKLIK